MQTHGDALSHPVADTKISIPCHLSIIFYPIASVSRYNCFAVSFVAFFPCLVMALVYVFHAGKRWNRVRGEDMPRTLTTVFGFALVAFSIGFNTARYPVVWQMVASTVEPTSLDEPSQPLTTASPSRIENTPPVDPPTPVPASLPVQYTVEKPVPETSDKIIIDASATIQPTLPVSEELAIADPQLPESAPPEKPLVPVPQIAASSEASVDAGFAAAVQRLPPVDRSESIPAVRYASPHGDGAISVYPSTVYPSTGIE